MAVATKKASSKPSTAPALELPLHYHVRSYQDAAWEAFRQGKKRHVAVWHRRAGKDTTYLNITVCAMHKRIGNYRHIFPTLKQGREILWDGIGGNELRYTDYFPEPMIYEKNESELSITLRHPQKPNEPGSQWQIVGTDRNLNALVGGNPVGLVFSEYAFQHPQGWLLAQPILRENGGWAAFCYTPRGDNHGHDLYKQAMLNPDEWFCSKLGIDDTLRDAQGENGEPVIRRAEIDADIAAGLIDEALAKQEYDCSFSAPQQGAYYAEQFALAEKQGRITALTWKPDLPVYTAWDLGVDDSTAIWFIQPVGEQRLHVIDYYEFWGQSLEHYAKVLREKPYVYGGHYAPHDIEVREMSARLPGSTAARTRKEIAASLGIRFITVGKWGIAEGIQAVRTMFPRFWFDAEGCSDGIKALKNYERLWDDKKKVFHDEPYHSWASHGADAMRTFAVGFRTPQALDGQQQYAAAPGRPWTAGQQAPQARASGGSMPWRRR